MIFRVFYEEDGLIIQNSTQNTNYSNSSYWIRAVLVASRQQKTLS